MAIDKNSPFYVTTPLFYVNAAPHLGSAYAMTVADTLARFHRQNGQNTLFLTGTDEHGDKIATMAAKEGKTPKAFADGISEKFQTAWTHIGMKPSIFYRTTQESHYKLVSNALTYLKNKDEIYFGHYSGKYCVGCERFRTDPEWNEQGLCPDHLTPPDLREESNYFFRMSRYRDKLIAYYKNNPRSIEPAFYKNEVLSFLEQPLEDLNISRPISRLQWGIPLPFDSNYVTYVWFDALLSYLGGLGYEGSPDLPNTGFQKQHWENSTQILGKDILKTHAIYWPTMLMALGLPPPKKLQITGFWMVNNQKMSKSLGNVIEPVAFHNTYGYENLRYFLLKEASFGSDANFSLETFVDRCNSVLANGLGNLASRVLTLTKKNLDSKVPTVKHRTEADLELLSKITALPELFKEEFEKCEYHKALMSFASAVTTCDGYINEQKPWALAKDPAQKARLEAVLGTAMDALAILATVIDCVLPEGAKKLRIALGMTESPPTYPANATEARVLFLKEGQQLGEVPRLFPRLEVLK